MSLMLSASRRWAALGLAGLASWVAAAQPAISPQAGEYGIVGSLPGDQVFVQLALNSAGGYIVWEDNVTDEDGSGISARRLDKNFAGVLSTLRINEIGAGDQQRPQVAMLKDGGAVFVWQGGPVGFPKIYARFLAADGTFVTGDVLVSTYQGGAQEDVQVATLSNGDVVLVWSSYGQDGSQDGVYGQRFSPVGKKVGDQFHVPQTTLLNQRTAGVAALRDGKFVVVWISEKEKGRLPNVDESGRNPEGGAGVVPLFEVAVFARLFDTDGPLGDEFKVNTSAFACANPVVTAGTDGGFLVAWSTKVGLYEVNGLKTTAGWDVFARGFGGDGTSAGPEGRINERTFGDQFQPKVCAFLDNYLMVWTSLGQDGSREGVIGRVVKPSGDPVGTEFGVNATTIGPQKLPAVASGGAGRCLVAWSSSVGGVASFDLYAQRYSSSQDLATPSKPFVTALNSSRLSVTWPELSGFDLRRYEIYMDDSSVPGMTTKNYWTSGPLAPASTHTFRLAYVLNDLRRSPLSEAGSGKTWGDDANFDGLPDDWQATYWGSDPAKWPSATADPDGDGASNLQEFLAGTDPTDGKSVLRVTWLTTPAGPRLTWTTQKGSIYQVQVSTDLQKWQDFGSARFAPGTIDSVPASQDGGKALYRIIRLR